MKIRDWASRKAGAKGPKDWGKQAEATARAHERSGHRKAAADAQRAFERSRGLAPSGGTPSGGINVKASSEGFTKVATLADRAEKASKEAETASRNAKRFEMEENAGRFHAQAAQAHKTAASLYRHVEKASGKTEEKVDYHENKAAHHAAEASASGDWDEDKHPRDDSGRFT